jgi:rhodanese-related sulfurtransferase
VNFLLDNWIWIVTALVTGAMLFRPSAGGRNAISVQDAVMLMNREKAVLIDVREPTEFAAGHASGARNIPLGSFDGSRNLPTNKTLPLILLCASGMRASRAASLAMKAGHEKVHVVSGGMQSWRAAHLPVETSA